MSFLPIPLLLWLWVAQPTHLLKLDIDPQPPSPGGEVELIITDPSGEAEVLRRKVLVPWHGELEIEPRFTNLRLEIASENFWAQPRLLPNLQGGELERVELFRRGEIAFTEVVAEAGEKKAPLVPIMLDVSSVPAGPGKNRLSKTSLVCLPDGDRWHCPAPAIDLDLRLEKADHVPLYLWGAKVEPGKTLDLGAIRFARGASISGYVTVEEGEPKGAVVVVEPAGSGSIRDGQRSELRKLTGAVNERGFFQVQGVAPGGFRLEASQAGLSPAEVFPVDVVEGRETALAEPLFLSRLAEIELHLSPPLSPQGKPWKIVFARLRQNTAVDPIEATADESGLWIRGGLNSGHYFLNILSPDGERTGSGSDSIWLSQDVDLDNGSPPLFLDLPLVAVHGSLRAGDQGLHGRLIFGGYFGAPHVAIWTDDEGDFAGALPREGEWKLDVEIDGQRRTLPPVNVKPLSGLAARVDVRLPDTTFRGRVSHRGKPVAGAELWGVRSTEPGKTAQFSIKSGEEGAFELKGADPGIYSLTASHSQLRLGAPKIRVEIREGSDAPMEIELEEFLRIDGQVLAAGQGVPGALFSAEIHAKNGDDLRTGVTNAAGVLGLVVPESTYSLTLLVAPQGFAWTLSEQHPRISGGGFAPFIVEVAQNGASLELNGDPRLLRLSRDGAEVALQLLVGALQSSGYLEQDGDYLVLHNAAPGFYRLCEGRNCAEGIASPGGSLILRLPDHQGAGSSGEVSEDS